MLRFKMLFNHRDNEAYMQTMSHEGWAATGYMEGLWFFDKCEPDEYVYRMCYLRGQTFQETEDLKKQWASRGIEFVSRYTYWGIVRAKQDFELYTPEEELELCKRIAAPFTGGIVAGAVVAAGALIFAVRTNLWYIVLAVLAVLYCAWSIASSNSYKRLMAKLKN